MKWVTSTKAMAFISLLWLLTVGAGTAILLKYSNTAGPDETAPAHWPTQTRIAQSSREATLIMFAHPRCPCTRASIGELAELMAHCQGLVSAHVVFFRPGTFDEDWTRSDLWRSAAAIPGVSVQSDQDGQEAKFFHAATSGHTMLYDTHGDLVFDGGITSARGHAGDNAGRDAIETFLHGAPTGTAQTPVFGCLILNPKSSATNGGE